MPAGIMKCVMRATPSERVADRRMPYSVSSAATCGMSLGFSPASLKAESRCAKATWTSSHWFSTLFQ